MASSAASLRATTKTAPSTSSYYRPQQKVEEKTEPTSNPFYKIAFDTALSPDDKSKAVAKELTFAGSKEQSKENVKELTEFTEYLQSVRQQMADEITKMTDTEAFSELHGVYNDLNQALEEFDKQLKPLTDIIDAVYTLRKNGVTDEALSEIENDRKADEEFENKKKALENRLQALTSDIEYSSHQIAMLSEDKTLGGFGVVRKASREKIASLQLEITQKQTDATALSEDIKTLISTKQEHSTALGEYAEQKAQLRSLLDIGSDEFKKMQEGLVQSALGFSKLAKDKMGSVRDHFAKMNTQIENLSDANGQMLFLYAILGEGIKGAEGGNETIRKTYEAAAEGESLITKMTREQNKIAVEDYQTTLSRVGAQTVKTLANLTEQSIGIKTQKDGNNEQLEAVASLHTEGVASVAERLSTVLTAVSQAALGEAHQGAARTMQRMNDSTGEILKKEFMKQAGVIAEKNVGLENALDKLSQFGDIVRAARGETATELQRMRENLSSLQNMAQGVQDEMKASTSAFADALVGTGSPEQKKEEAPKGNNPFKLAS